jgi:hypothetical protein
VRPCDPQRRRTVRDDAGKETTHHGNLAIRDPGEEMVVDLAKHRHDALEQLTPFSGQRDLDRPFSRGWALFASNPLPTRPIISPSRAAATCK